MKFTIFSIFIILVSIVSSCNNEAERQAMVSDFNIMYIEMNKTSKAINDFWHEMLTATKTADIHPEKRIDSTYAESIVKQYESSTNILNTAIANISVLTEVDPDLLIKEKILVHLQNTKDLQETAIPKSIDAIRNGLDIMTDDERNAFLQFHVKGEELQKESDELSKSVEIFILKHNITKQELDMLEK